MKAHREYSNLENKIHICIGYLFEILNSKHSTIISSLELFHVTGLHFLEHLVYSRRDVLAFEQKYSNNQLTVIADEFICGLAV